MLLLYNKSEINVVCSRLRHSVIVPVVVVFFYLSIKKHQQPRMIERFVYFLDLIAVYFCNYLLYESSNSIRYVIVCFCSSDIHHPSSSFDSKCNMPTINKRPTALEI